MGKPRKSSGKVTLVLIGLSALAGCGGDDTRRDVYKTREDCLADWGNKPQDCSPATDPRHASSGFWYGPSYLYRSSGSGASWGGGSATGRSVGSTSSSSGTSRGGFGSTAHSSAGG